MTPHRGDSTVKIFIMASADYSWEIVLLGPEQAKDLTSPSPEDLAEPSAVGIRRKRLFLVLEFEISPPQGDINILGH